MDYQSIATFIMEMAGTVAFAASGAMVGVERNMDIFGISVLGVATAVGGGMIRDIVLGVIPPAVFRNPVYALVSVLTSCVVFFVFYFKREFLEGHTSIEASGHRYALQIYKAAHWPSYLSGDHLLLL